MATKPVRAVIAGAGSALGKELAEQINNAPVATWDLALLDEGAGGQITAAGDEALVVSALEPGSFAGADIVFFAGDAAQTRTWWKIAQAAGANVVDLSGALDDEPGVPVRAPSLRPMPPDLSTVAVVAAHPAAVLLARVLTPLQRSWGGMRAAATVLEPASQSGQAGMDELHQQTVALLSFQSLPTESFGAQVAFTARETFGAGSPWVLAARERRIQQHLEELFAEVPACAVQLVHAPVFHGYAASVWVDTGGPYEANALHQALRSPGLQVVSGDGDGDGVSNLSASGQPDVLVRVRVDEGRSDGFWLWLAADNLVLAAQTAMACAAELLAARPAGGLQ